MSGCRESGYLSRPNRERISLFEQLIEFIDARLHFGFTFSIRNAYATGSFKPSLPLPIIGERLNAWNVCRHLPAYFGEFDLTYTPRIN